MPDRQRDRLGGGDQADRSRSPAGAAAPFLPCRGADRAEPAGSSEAAGRGLSVLTDRDQATRCLQHRRERRPADDDHERQAEHKSCQQT